MTIPLPNVLKPKINEIELKNNKITENEIKFILDKTLNHHHRQDPNILKFIDSYLHYRSVSKASNDIGITSKEGQSLRRKADIDLAITQLTDRSVQKYGYDATEVIERTKDIMNVDPAVFQNSDGTYKESLDSIPFEHRGAIKKFKVKNEYGVDANGIKTITGKIIEVEFWDKLKAIDLLGKEKNIFKDSLEINTNMQISITGALSDAEQRLISARDVTDE